ncbi:hypothetical protein Cni_G22936 [Canna indica]|uniref:Uncharacterized protein n=1 Tax=Canna indica TaxID=4628 RepID=A0AAQ3KXL2_9LILI|nr:hypothetical protein Cni_G22936 [Canna indica]
MSGTTENGTSISVIKVHDPQAGALPQRSMFSRIAAKVKSVGGTCLHALASPGAGTLIFTSVCLVLAYQHKKKLMRATPQTRPEAGQDMRPPLNRSLSVARLIIGQKAIERFQAIYSAADDESSIANDAAEAKEEIRKELQQKNMDFVKLYKQIGIIEMSSKKDQEEAIKALEEALKKANYKDDENQVANAHTHVAHELELLLVELLIYKGDYDKALSYPCLIEKDVSSVDFRVPFYQAIIHVLKNDTNKAKNYYDKFKDIRGNFHGPKFYEGVSPVPEFSEFMKIVKTLKEENKNADGTAALPSTREGKKTATPAPPSTENTPKMALAASPSAENTPKMAPAASPSTENTPKMAPAASPSAENTPTMAPAASPSAENTPTMAPAKV